MLSNQSRTWFVPWLGSVTLGAAAWLLAYLWLSVHGQTSDLNELSTCYGIIAWGISFVIFYGLWEGVSVNVLNCPARYIPPEPPRSYPDLSSYGGYNQTAAVEFQPGIVLVPTDDPNIDIGLHITAEQLLILKKRVRQNQFGLPINGVDGISSTQMKLIRKEAVDRELARDKGNNIIEWTQEGATGIHRASPTPVVRG
jgi:hypothetical protein